MSKGKERTVTVVVTPHRCKACGLCIEVCPKDVLEFSQDFNTRGVHYPEIVRPGNCIGCGMCQNICPDLAIYLKDE